MLNKREREVLQLMCRQGLTYAEAGQALYVSRETIKNHLTNIRKKTGEPRLTKLCWRIGVTDGERQRGASL